MHIGFPIQLSSNLTITLIQRNNSRVHCEESLVHPCAQHLAVAERGCLFTPPEPADCPENIPARWPYEVVDTPPEAAEPPYIPHRIPPDSPIPGTSGHSTMGSLAALIPGAPSADVIGRHINLLA